MRLDSRPIYHSLPFVATSANDPATLEARVKVIVAEVPFEFITTFEIVMAGGWGILKVPRRF
jgi:hypothetical protein